MKPSEIMIDFIYWMHHCIRQSVLCSVRCPLTCSYLYPVICSMSNNIKYPYPVILLIHNHTKCLYRNIQRVCTTVLSAPRYGQCPKCSKFHQVKTFTRDTPDIPCFLNLPSLLLVTEDSTIAFLILSFQGPPIKTMTTCMLYMRNISSHFSKQRFGCCFLYQFSQINEQD